jgi:hypothetical protein
MKAPALRIAAVVALALSAFVPFACPAQSQREASAAPTAIQLGLAIADFTGDTHPDLATVKLNGLGSYAAQYVIEIQLTEGGRQSLELVAPQGGVYITPKDVTGDGALDLIVRASTSRAVVAVFLNDGYGGFSHRGSDSFAHNVDWGLSGYEFTANQPHAAQAVVASWSCPLNSPTRSRQRSLEKRAAAVSRERARLVDLAASLYSNRAPPVAA